MVLVLVVVVSWFATDDVGQVSSSSSPSSRISSSGLLAQPERQNFHKKKTKQNTGPIVEPRQRDGETVKKGNDEIERHNNDSNSVDKMECGQLHEASLFCVSFR